jgi:hypothetical protein
MRSLLVGQLSAPYNIAGLIASYRTCLLGCQMLAANSFTMPLSCILVANILIDITIALQH